MIEAYPDIPAFTEKPSSQAPIQHTQATPYWWTLAMVHWLQHKLSQILSQLRLLSLTRGRSFRWRRCCRQLIQAGVALLIATSFTFSSLALTGPGYASNSIALPDATANPFNGVDIGDESAPSFADLDGDGDLDAFIGSLDGTIKYFHNSGSTTSPAFVQTSGSLNPFDGNDVGMYSTPSFADLDADGDLDAFIGEADGIINYFQNTGSATSPAFFQYSSLNPVDGMDVGDYSTPSFADLDADGDLDFFSGEKWDTPYYFENTGNARNPDFFYRGGSFNPFNSIDLCWRCKPSFADQDADGDLDAFIGETQGVIQYFENTGNASNPAFVKRSGSLNPFGSVDVGSNSAPSFADLDRDGDLDLFIGASDGTIRYIENTRSTASPQFTARSSNLNPLNFVDVGFYSKPSFVDLDADGDLDAFIGENERYIDYFENTGSATNPAFIERTGTLNPLVSPNTWWNSAPSFADLDGDGDLDAFSGEFYGTIIYFENTGNATNPAFIQRSGSLNPFYGYDVGQNTTPSFADLDADGDLDAFIGEYEGIINYFENAGNATSPVLFIRGSLNPFGSVDVGSNSAPSFADLDRDGDLDAFSGEKYGTIRYFQNIGSATSPAFVQRTGSLNPLNGKNVPSESIPSFADLDGDGDLDAFIGENNGTIYYFENTLFPWHINLPLVRR